MAHTRFTTANHHSHLSRLGFRGQGFASLQKAQAPTSRDSFLRISIQRRMGNTFGAKLELLETSLSFRNISNNP